PLRETHVMSLRSYLAERAVLNSPLLDAGQLEHLEVEFSVRRVGITFAVAEGVEGARSALDALRSEVVSANATKPELILLTDRGADAEHAALPALLALAVAWKSLTQSGAW